MAVSFPLVFLGWNFYNSGNDNLFSSMLTVMKDFLWPISVVCAQSLSFNPY